MKGGSRTIKISRAKVAGSSPASERAVQGSGRWDNGDPRTFVLVLVLGQLVSA